MNPGSDGIPGIADMSGIPAIVCVATSIQYWAIGGLTTCWADAPGARTVANPAAARLARRIGKVMAGLRRKIATIIGPAHPPRVDAGRARAQAPGARARAVRPAARMARSPRTAP